MIIYGNTVATNMLRADFAETDPGKSSFILGKPDVALAQQTADRAVWDAKNAQQTADAALPRSGGEITGAISVPTPTQPGHAATKDYCDTVRVELTLTAEAWSAYDPYTQTLAVEALTEGKKARAFPRWPEQPDLALKEEMEKITAAWFEPGSVTFSCWEYKPERDLSILLEVYV